MPAPEVTTNEIRIRVREPNLFIEDSFKYIDISTSKGIRAVIGKLKSDPEGGTVVQSYRFDKEKWTVQEASTWVKEHEGKTLDAVVGLYKDLDISGRQDSKVLKYVRAKILKVDEKTKTVRAVVSTEDVDRDREINLISSWKGNLRSYKEHPVLLSSHSYNSLQNQIGEAAGIEIDNLNKQLIMEFKYYAGEGNSEADWGYSLASKGMAMYSVGYIPIKVLEGDAIPEEYRAKEPRRVFAENELLEVSQVVIGSNRGALQMGIINPTSEQNQYLFDVVKSFGKDIPDFDKIEIKAEPAPGPSRESAPAVKEPVKPEYIISPVEIKNLKEFEEITGIIKSGRVISNKNRTTISQAIESLKQASTALEQLLEMTNPESDEDEGKQINVELEQTINGILSKAVLLKR